MENNFNVLIVSNRLENKKVLLQMLADLPVNVFTAGTILQAKEVLSGRSVRLIFSEERVADGTYKELLSAISDVCQIVLMLSTGEWEECLEAMRLGVREVIHCPLQLTDVELAFIHAVREQARISDISLERPALRTQRNAKNKPETPLTIAG